MRLTKKEIVKIITAIKIQCPEALPYRNENEFDILVDMWNEILKDYPKEVVWAAVRNALKNTVFQKQNWIGAICQEIDKMQTAYEKTAEELWAELTGVLNEVNKCVYKFRFTYIERNGKTQGENARLRVKEIYNNLSPELKDYVRNESTLIELADLTDQQLNFEKGRFLKTVPQIKERAKTRAQTGDMANLLQGLNIFFIEENTEH
jgi:hypothetical protein